MDSMTFVLFGATGDLAKRKIYPALYNLYVDQKMPSSFSVIGLGRRDVSDVDFQARVEASLHTFSRRSPEDAAKVRDFLGAFRYTSLNNTKLEDYKKLLEVVEKREQELGIPQNRMFYLSVAPEFFEPIAENIKESGLGSGSGWKRLIIEKPFGHDLESAIQLNEKLNSTFAEEEIYRIDHFLGKPMVQNLEVLSATNPVMHALWGNHYISNVQITASETVGVEERAEYYDHTGAVRDMFQNHMLQLLMMISLHLPKKSSPDEVRAKKRNTAQSLIPLEVEALDQYIVRAQYQAGDLQGKPVVGYLEEPGIEGTSKNDTYFAARLFLDDPFWTGVPFYIRTGKRMSEKSTRIVVEFKQPLNTGMSEDEAVSANLLTIDIGPKEGMRLTLNSKSPMHHDTIEPMELSFNSSYDNVPEAYENLIFDALRKDATFFAHWDEVELSWRWVEPILKAFAADEVPLHYYAAGSEGPEAADELLAQDGNRWH
ncbi:glucose-6-phosphate dehydrogenase [Paenibacillus provencensis]|uniref:Glucose-6-phosphate 1-dehydrogenase n=1 Tax=Paenibacillus provencensis TaxID=441151 RepID=A0ABW3Q9Z4_9BACL|nr:glucose-6-phosphate dehydrogenase [Paenibacillus sp. MER 78]MCM3129759.1 glucose-6-phosphate dehydrogenase [Paenibacillus sp. MER 78]